MGQGGGTVRLKEAGERRRLDLETRRPVIWKARGSARSVRGGTTLRSCAVHQNANLGQVVQQCLKEGAEGVADRGILRETQRAQVVRA